MLWNGKGLACETSILDGEPLEGRLHGKPRAPEIQCSDLFAHVFTRPLNSSQQRITAYGRSTGCIVATKLVWTAAAAVILNGSEASAPLANGRGLKCIARRCINLLEAKGGPSNPPCLRSCR